MLTTQQRMLHKLQTATLSLTVKEIQSVLFDRQVKITLAEVEQELD
jgi:hypothetical protein